MRTLLALQRGLPALFATFLILAVGCGKSTTKPPVPPTPEPGYYVDPVSGLDTHDGSSSRPFRTVTHAIAATPDSAEIHLLPGGYDLSKGEIFPLLLKPGQALIGDTLTRGRSGPSSIWIDGHGSIPWATPGSFAQFATIVAAAGCRVSGLQLGSYNSPAHFIVVSKDAGVTVSHNLLLGPSYGGVYLTGSGRCVIRDNEFGTDSYGVCFYACTDSVLVEDNDFVEPAQPVYVAGASDRTIVRKNHIGGSGQAGINVRDGAPRIVENVFQKHDGYPTDGAIWCWNGDASPWVRRNVFVDCVLAIRVEYGIPDLGTEGDPGLNDFSGVRGPAVSHSGPAAVMAIGNTWQHAPPTKGADIVVTGNGSVRWGPGANEIYP